MSTHCTFTLRRAEPRDLPALAGLIHELADFENLSHLVQTTPDALAPHLFGERPVAEALVAEVDGAVEAPRAGAIVAPRDGAVVAFALFFTNFSTFLARPGLYLEDLYVQPAHRGQGIARALMSRLAALAIERGCGRFEWTVLDWNSNAIAFYEDLGATVMPEWRICRVTGEALQTFGQRGGPAAGGKPP